MSQPKPMSSSDFWLIMFIGVILLPVLFATVSLLVQKFFNKQKKKH